MRRQGHEGMHGFGTTIFAEMSALAGQTGAINLGQGFPDTDGPPEILEAAKRAIDEGVNQYAPGRGLPVLREAIVQHQRDWYGIDLDPEAHVVVTTGATEGLAAAVLALIEPGEEVVVLEPYFDVYAATVALARGVLRTVPLSAPDFRLDMAALETVVGPRTRMILLNTPHNPTGRVLTSAELSAIARVAREHDLLVVSDEVYEHLTFDGVAHVPFATLPGMFERTLTVSSGGKTFSVTGWKVGWVTGPADLVTAVLTVKQYLSFVSGAPFQPAIALGLLGRRKDFRARAEDLGRRRDVLREGLTEAGFRVLGVDGTAQAGYFLVADASPFGADDAPTFAGQLARLAGVVGIPMSSFYLDPASAGPLLRFAFCKQEAVLRQASARLRNALTADAGRDLAGPAGVSR